MSTNRKYKIGDIVKLNAGGPDMAISRVFESSPYEDSEITTYECQWFAGKKLDSGQFKEPSLILVTAQGTENGT